MLNIMWSASLYYINAPGVLGRSVSNEPNLFPGEPSAPKMHTEIPGPNSKKLLQELDAVQVS